MRTRTEIEHNGKMNIGPKDNYEIIKREILILEVLLDIRDLLTPKVIIPAESLVGENTDTEKKR